MTKSELIAVVAARAELNKTQAEKAVNAVIDAISNTLAGGEDVAITGFGTFTAKSRPAREGRTHAPAQPCRSPPRPRCRSSPARPSRTR